MIPWRTSIRSKAIWLSKDPTKQIYDEVYTRKHFLFGVKVFERDFQVEHDISKIDANSKPTGFGK